MPLPSSSSCRAQLLVAAASDLDAVKRTVTVHRGTRKSFGIGIVVDPAGNFRVHSVADGSPAEAAGVRAGERILVIDGVELVAPEAWQAWVEHLQRSETVTLVTIPDDSPIEGDSHHSVRSYRVARGPNGFGMSLKSDVVTRGVRVNDLIVGGPAEAAGISEGDVITHINGESMLDKSHDEVVAALAASDEVAEIEVQHRSAIEGGERIVALDCTNGAGIKYGVRANSEYPQVGVLCMTLF